MSNHAQSEHAIYLPGAGIRVPGPARSRPAGRGRRPALPGALRTARERSARRRLTADLHDHFGQLLATLRLELRSAVKHADPSGRRTIGEALDVLRDMSREVRDLSLELRALSRHDGLS